MPSSTDADELHPTDESFIDRMTRFGTSVRRAAVEHHASLIIGFAICFIVVLFLVLFPERSPDGVANLGQRSVLYFIVIVIVAASVKGMTGFGYGTISAPVAAALVDPQTAFIVLAIPALMLNVFQIAETGVAREFLREEKVIVVAALIGSFLGVYVLGSFAASPVLPAVLAVLLLGYVGYEVSHGFVTVDDAGRPSIKATVSLSHGFTHGAFNLGPLFPGYLHTYERDVNRYIGGVSIITGLVLFEKILLMAATGLLTASLAWLGSVIALVTLVGIGVGTLLRRRVNPAYVHRLIVALLFVVSLKLLWDALTM